MRALLIPLMTLMVGLAQAGEQPNTLHGALQKALCDAAPVDSAMPAQVDALIESGIIDFHQGPDIFAIRCGNQSLLELLVTHQRAENLEYLVIDMGVNPDTPVAEYRGRQVSVNQLLSEQVASGNVSQRAFAFEYLDLLADAEFNPSLWISMQ